MIRTTIILFFCISIFTYVNEIAAGEFTRADLQAAVDSYLAAARSGEISEMALAPGVKYIENAENTTLGEGIWKTPLNIDFHRSLLDVVAGETFTEVIVTDKTHPCVIGTRLKISGGKIREIISLVTDEGDWLFNADIYLKWSSTENWDVIPVDKRSDREALVAAADAYLDMFNDPSSKVPWGKPCARLEGGIYIRERDFRMIPVKLGFPERAISCL